MTICDLKKGERFRVRLRDGGLSHAFIFDRIEGGQALCFCATPKALEGIPAELSTKDCFVVREANE